MKAIHLTLQEARARKAEDKIANLEALLSRQQAAPVDAAPTSKSSGTSSQSNSFAPGTPEAFSEDDDNAQGSSSCSSESNIVGNAMDTEEAQSMLHVDQVRGQPLVTT